MIKLGAIILCTGFILFLFSFIHSYPIQLLNINEKTFNQFHIYTWPAIVFLIFGSFIIGYLSEKKIVRGFCAAFIPLIFYSYVYFFRYVPSSDCGNVRSMFLIFKEVGIDANYIPYFQYPSYFLNNELTSELLMLNADSLSFIYFSLYGFLLALFLYLLYHNISGEEYKRYAFVFVTFYFIGIYSFLNYQWVPQTLALVYMFNLIYLTSIIYKNKDIGYKYLLILVFIPFVFSHAFLPVIFIIFFGLIMFKKVSLRTTFILMISANAIVMIYFTTYYFPFFIETLQESLNGFSGEYTARIASSFQPPEELLSKIISNINRFRVPIAWMIIGLGSLVIFLKKKMETFVFRLGFAGGLYLIVGMLLSVMGLRSIQIILIPLTIGLGFFLVKFKKPTILIITIILLLVVFGPMREAYDITQFHSEEEANACVFLATNVNKQISSDVATNQVNFGYFKNLYRYHTLQIPSVVRSGNPVFYEIFNQSMKKNDYVIYNLNLGKEILGHGIREEKLNELNGQVLLNNKIFASEHTRILSGIHN